MAAGRGYLLACCLLVSVLQLTWAITVLGSWPGRWPESCTLRVLPGGQHKGLGCWIRQACQAVQSWSGHLTSVKCWGWGSLMSVLLGGCSVLAQKQLCSAQVVSRALAREQYSSRGQVTSIPLSCPIALDFGSALLTQTHINMNAQHVTRAPLSGNLCVPSPGKPLGLDFTLRKKKKTGKSHLMEGCISKAA